MIQVSLSSWIKEKYEELEQFLKKTEGDRLKEIAEYRNFNNPSDFVISLIRQELAYYEKDLRFADWLKKKFLVYDKAK